MRLIDVDVIVNTLNDGLKKNVEYFKDKQKKPEDIAIEVMAELVLESIKQQPTIEIPKWIPCNDRLPENHGYYVVTAEMDSERYIRMAVYDRYGFGVRMFETVVAWMNIEEYKGE